MNHCYGNERDDAYPDHSNFLWHLTKDHDPLNGRFRFGEADRNNYPLNDARHRLISILTQPVIPTIWCSHLHYMNPNYHTALNQAIRCVCFTECIPHSMPIHAQRFGRFGLLFTKDIAYNSDSRPVWYLDAELMNRFARCNVPAQRGGLGFLDFSEELLHLLMPFVPPYGEYRMGGRTLDFTVEREWRMGHDYRFNFEDISAIIVPTQNDIQPIVNEVPESGNCNFITFENIENEDVNHFDFDHYFQRI